MRLYNLCVAVLLLSVTEVSVAGRSIVPNTTLAAQTANNTSATSTFVTQSNGNVAAGNVSKVDVHSLLYPGATTKVYAHLMLWFGKSDHMNVGYSSTDAAQIHRQITDMISRGIDGVIIDWYGPNNSIDQATKLVMAEAETHPSFTFAIMVDQGAIHQNSCSGCSPQQALIQQLQYVEQTYFPSPAYMTSQGRPVITNFNIDLFYTIDWNAVNAALATPPVFLFQNNDGFTHLLSQGSYAWVMPTTTDSGMSYLASFYKTGIPLKSEETVGASYKGFNDTLASWTLHRIMSQQCGHTWLQTFSEINGLYNSGQQLSALQLVTWNDYEEATEIESGISNCLTISASVSTNSLHWTVAGDESTVDHFVAYISTDTQNLMSLGEVSTGLNSLNLCSYSLPDGNYVSYVQAVGKPSITNQMSGGVKFALNCSNPGGATLSLGTNPSSVTLSSGGTSQLNVTVTPHSGSVNTPVALTCSGLPQNLNCAFLPASVTPGSSSATSVLTVTSASVAARNYGNERHRTLAIEMVSFGLLAFALIGNVERRRLVTIVVACSLVGLMIGGTSCGGKTLNAATSVPACYVVTINGNAGSVQASTMFTITLK